jgi:hypothetical protein
MREPGKAVPESGSLSNLAARERAIEMIVVTNTFDWRQIEVSEYPEFITRLRAVRCPEKTIREIVFMDLLGVLQWPTSSAQAQDSSRFLKAMQMMDKLFEAGAGLAVGGILGLSVDPVGARDDLELQAIQKRLSELMQASQSEPPTEAMVIQTHQLMAEYEARLLEALGPTAFAEQQFQTSQLPEVIRREAADIDLTDTEVRKAYEIEAAYERDLSSGKDPMEALAERTAQLNSVLGTERAEEYALSRSPAFQEAKAYGMGVGLDPTRIKQLAELQQYYETTDLVDADARAGLQESAKELLGSMYAHYKQHGGYWLGE